MLFAVLGSIPSICKEPFAKGINPVIALNRVDFPPPFGPTTATNFPSVTENVTSSKASVSSY